MLVLQPGRDDCALMGLNLMSGSRRVQVMEQARKSVARELHRLRGTHLLPARRARTPRARRHANPARRGRQALTACRGREAHPARRVALSTSAPRSRRMPRYDGLLGSLGE